MSAALAEDLGDAGDITAQTALAAGRPGTARILARAPGVLAGMEIAKECFRQLDDRVEFGPPIGATPGAEAADGTRLAVDEVLLTVAGDARALLAAERTALNYLQRLSGVATRVAAFVAAVEGLPARILDTRKTTPGLRGFEKYAVLVGGGANHRIGLFDQVLLKENHFAMSDRSYEEVVRAAVGIVDAPVIAEAQTLEEGLAAVAGGAGVVLLDNFRPGASLREAVSEIRAAASRIGTSVEIEASGGVTLDTVRSFAECGVDRISVGALTHSVPALDLSMLSTTTP